MSMRHLNSRDIALVLVRIDRRAGRGYNSTLERIQRYTDCHPMSARVLYDLAEDILRREHMVEDVKGNQTAAITQGPHLLFTGANGHKTYGITVRVLDEEDARNRGLLLSYNLNDYTIAKHELPHLGLNQEEVTALKIQMAGMAISQE